MTNVARREVVAEAYASYYGFLGAEDWEDMSGEDRQRCRGVAGVVLAALGTWDAAKATETRRFTMSTAITNASDVGRDTLVELAEDIQVDSGVRLRAAEVLKSFGDPVGVAILVVLAQEAGDLGVRLRAAEVLAA